LLTKGLRSWSEFANQDAPQLHFVFTVGDNAAKEVRPLCPGGPITAHWGLPDLSAAVAGTPEQIERAYRDAFKTLDRRVGLFLALPLASLESEKSIGSGSNEYSYKGEFQ
jgi:arsenate reductase